MRLPCSESLIYVPLDAAYPAERISYMLSDSQASVLLTQSQLVSSFPEYQGHIVSIDTDWEAISTESEENPESNVTPNNLAYIIYTSGSTGKPKGVEITHSSVVNLLSSISKTPGLTKEDTLVAVTSISFDVSVFEIYLPLIVGARLVIASREVVRDGTELIKLLVREKTTIMTATPATWRMLLEAGWQLSQNLKILCTGERLSRELADRLLEKSTSMWNLYGPTEITVWATLYRVEAKEGSVSIGKAIANTATYILDSEGQPVPVGEPGELHIGGLGLARGYLNRPQLTSEKFITNPLANSPWERLYKTGDLVRYIPALKDTVMRSESFRASHNDGNIEFLGRIDDQVKIRGYRIELGEIEAALSQNSEVKQSVVVAREDAVNQKRLIAYIVPGSSSESVPKTDQQKEQWQEIWDEAYKQPEDEIDPTFHIGGWNDSYTGKDLAPKQVKEWVDYTVDRILALQPKHLLEIGCGTGLLLFRISPRQGGPNVNNSQLLMSGLLDFAIGGATGVIKAIESSIPKITVASFFQKAPSVLIAHPNVGNDKIENLRGKPIYLTQNNVAQGFWLMLKEKYGFSDEQIRPYNFSVTPFLQNKNSAQQGLFSSEPFTIEKKGGLKPIVFLLADYDYNPYSMTIETPLETVEKNPDLVQRFVTASIEGWKSYFTNPQPANDIIKQENPEMTDDLIVYGIEKMQEYGIVTSGDAETLGIGAMTDARCQEFFNSQVSLGIFDPNTDYKQAYTLDFIGK